MNTEKLVNNLIQRSRVVSHDAVSGTYEVPSAYEIIHIGWMRSSGFIDNIVRHKCILSHVFFYIGYLNK
jgi:hypothetical protein